MELRSSCGRRRLPGFYPSAWSPDQYETIALVCIKIGPADRPLQAQDRGLRVADAAIMPSDCRANTHFTCMMIGENIAARMRG